MPKLIKRVSRHLAKRSGFTAVELLLVMIVIAVIAGLVIVAINPKQQLTDAEDAKRLAAVQQTITALEGEAWESLNDPTAFDDLLDSIPIGEENALPICPYGGPYDGCVNLDLLIDSGRLSKLPYEGCGGFVIYRTVDGIIKIKAVHLGIHPNDVSAGCIGVTPIAGLVTTEAGGTAQFEVVLRRLPSDTVTIPTISSSDTGEGTVSPSSLTFTTSNWNTPQTVTMTGVDDGDHDGTQDYTIVLASATSADSSYNGEDPADVSVKNADDETSVCGNSAVEGAEECDDGDTDDGDGCSSSCTVESGYTCSGNPSVCEQCGNGVIEGTEACDDGDTDNGDGCSSTCTVESGYTCSGEPSACYECGNGLVEGSEECDDGDTDNGDGCSSSCTVESGYTCSGEPSACYECGNGVIEGSEECDDNDTDSGDGCSSACIIESGWSCSGTPSSCTQQCVSAFQGGGDGSPGDPYQITSCADVQCMEDDLNASYTLTQNVDCSDSQNWNGGDGFIPVANGTFDEFQGTLDGGGYTISDLYISNDTITNYATGLFSETDGANVTNLTLTGAYVTTDTGNATPIGILVGLSEESTTLSGITIVNGTVDCGRTHCGGLVGQATDTTTITNVSATVSVTATYYLSPNAGGLVGLMNNSATISGASVSGTVSANTKIGGLVGDMNAVTGGIYNSSSSANVTWDDPSDTGNYIGGLVGRLANGDVHDSYATGTITGNYYMGGLVGENFGGEIRRSYATGNVNIEKKSSGAPSCASVGGLVGWERGDGIYESYATGNIVEIDCFVGNKIGGLIGWLDGTTVSGSYATGTTNGGTSVGGLIGLMEDSGADAKNVYATGDVNGTTNVGGLIGYLDDHMTVRDGYATGDVDATSGTVGGLIGYSDGNSINVFSTGDVSGGSLVGGFIGNFESAGNSLTNTYYHDTAGNPNDGCVGGSPWAGCTAQGGAQSYFYDEANEPLGSWNFSTWSSNNPTTFPTLQ